MDEIRDVFDREYAKRPSRYHCNVGSIVETIISIGGMITGGAAAGQEQKQAEEALEYDIGTAEIVEEHGEEIAAEISEDADLQRTHAAEQHTKALANLAESVEEARAVTFEQQRGTQLQGAEIQEDILVANEMALGQEQGKLATSGIRRVGSATEILQAVELGGVERVDRIERSLEEAERGYASARGRLETAAAREESDLALRFDQTVESISRAEDRALSAGERTSELGLRQLDYMRGQYDFLTSPGQKFLNIVSGIFLGYGSSANLAKQAGDLTRSFF